MLSAFDLDTPIVLEFSKKNLTALRPYFDLDFVPSILADRQRFFHNLRILSRRSLGLAHCIQHNAVPRIAVQLSQSRQAREQVLSREFDDIIGCYSIVKRSDEISLEGSRLSGRKKWFSNLDQADFGVMQIPDATGVKLIWFDMHTLPHEKDYDFFRPIGMELARAGTLVVKDHQVPADHVLGVHGTNEFFQQSNFASYCFLTNHCGLTHQLFLDIKAYAEKFNCGTEFELMKLETDVASLVMQWEANLDTLAETRMSNEFWHRRNTQYAFSKKTLIRVIQLTLEIGVSYYLDAASEYSQRFRDALTYCSHMHPLYKFGQDFHTLDLARYK